MKKIRKKHDDLEDDLAYILWQAEVDRDLQNFWKAFFKKDF